jgi:phospholipid:diacylglycerol acyltransferase
LSGEKVLIVTHSYGENVGRAFYTSMGSEWVESHLEAVVNIAGTVLGVPKAITALLSGELS